jgi:hypothetical protein
VRTGGPILLVMLVAVAAGCGSHSKKDAAPSGPAVPWIAKKPAVLDERAAVSTLCRASDLTIASQIGFEALRDGGIAAVPIRNTSTHTCRLTGRPSVRILKKNGPMQVQTAIAPPIAIFPDVSYPDSHILALRPNELAALTIEWDNWCDPLIPGKPHIPPSGIRITLPGGRGSLTADYNAVPGCTRPKDPSNLGVGPFQSPNIVPGTPWTPGLIQATVPDQPVHGRRGGVLRFRVVLRNRSDATVRFGRCPSYMQQLAPAGKVEVFELNCAAAHPIAPGKSLAFAIQMQVPAKAPTGPNGLFWALDAFGARQPSINVRAVVDG